MDYLFPPSRTPKQSILDPPADRRPPPTVQTTIQDTPTMTTLQERATTLGRKSHNKVKTTASSIRPTASTPTKTKKNSHKNVATDTTVDTKTTQTLKTETVPTTNFVTATVKPPKRYTIRPVRTTATPAARETESTINTNSDVTETVSVSDVSGTTADVAKDTASTQSTVVETHSTDGTTSTGVESTTLTESTVTESADSREGYLPLRDKPQQNHVKINEQTNKEVSASRL